MTNSIKGELLVINVMFLQGTYPKKPPDFIG